MLVSNSTLIKDWLIHAMAQACLSLPLCLASMLASAPPVLAQQCPGTSSTLPPGAHLVDQSAAGSPHAPSAADAGNATRASPLVTLKDDQLTIAASDASLSEILEEIRVCTGADLDIPPETSGERVTVHLGPGPPRRILADLLVWTKFDYIIQASAENPLSIQTIVLMQGHKGEAATTAGTPTNAKRQVTSPSTRPLDNSALLTEPSEANAEPSQSAGPPTAAEHATRVQAKVSDLAPSADANAAKSTTEMIQQLQQMYQERKAIQLLRMNGSNSSPPGG